MGVGFQPEFDPLAALGLSGGPGADDPDAAELDSLFMQGEPGEPDQGAGHPGDTPSGLLDEMIAIGERYMRVEPDAEDRHTMSKLLASLRQYQARESKALDAARTSSSAALKYLGRRA